MRADALPQHARGRLKELPAAGLGHPVGTGRKVLKVRDKVFMLRTEIAREPTVDTAASPKDGKAFREQREDITPRYQTNKQYGITSYPAAKLQERVIESYLLVPQNRPQAKRPLGPATFGKGER